MKNNIKNILLVASLSLVVACSNNEDPITLSGGNEVRFNVGIAGYTETRVATDADFNAVFEDGNHIGIYAVEGTNVLGGAEHASNIKYTKSAGGWDSALPISFPVGGSELSFYAYYPYQTISNAKAIEFAVATDQSSGISSSDFMVATATGNGNTQSTVNLTFHHQLALVQVTLYSENTDFDAAKISGVSIGTVATSLKIDLSNQEQSDLGTSGNIVMYQADANNLVYWVVIPPQTITAASSLVTLRYDGETYAYELTSDMIFKKKTVKKLRLKIDTGGATAGKSISLSNSKVDNWGVGNGESGENVTIAKD